MAERLTMTGKLINVAIVIAFIGILFGTWTQIPGCVVGPEDRLTPVETEEPVCTPVIPVKVAVPTVPEAEQKLEKMPTTMCGSMRGYVICGIENGIVVMTNDCWIQGHDLTPTERDHYCGEGQPGGRY